MRNSQALKIQFLLIPILLMLGLAGPSYAQDVIRAAGGTDLSIDNIGGEYTPISGPTIRETSAGQLQQGGTIVLTIPSGYEWNTNLSENDIEILIEGVGANNTDLEIEFFSISASEAVFTVTSRSRSAGNGQGPGRVTFSGLELRPSNTTIPDEGMITNTGTTGPTSANYGNLSKVAGSINEVTVETAADGTGEIVSSQDIPAGNSLTVYAVGRDIGGNFIENISLESENDWTLTEITGGIVQGSLTPSNNLQSATFSSQSTGSASIQAVFQGATPVPSGTITVLPRQARDLVISTQPSESATAGQPFNRQPEIQLIDIFGNLVTTDNETEIAASIHSGQGTLSGTTSLTASEGVVQFTDLFAELAESIQIVFNSPTLSSDVVSEIIDVQPASPSALGFSFVPASGNQGINLTPPVRVQLFDEFGNQAPQSGIPMDLSINSGTGQLQGVTTAQTESNGEALFDQLSFNTQGEKILLAESAGLASATSNAINILSENEVSGFLVEIAGGGDIPDQSAGTPFQIDIYAVNGAGTIITDYEGTVNLSSSSQFVDGEGITPSFTNGTLTGYEVTLSTAGEHTLSVTDSDNTTLSGSSNSFLISPASVDFSNTVMSASPQAITSDGSSSSLITVQLRDAFENNLISGGETITIETDRGTLNTPSESDATSVTAFDNGDGTYTATLTSTESVETATITAFNSGVQITSTTVEFTFGEVSEFIVTVPETGGATEEQIAGNAFPISIEAVDANQNRVENYSGTVTISSNSELTSGGSVLLSNGFADDHFVTLTQSGESITVSAQDEDLFNLFGTSKPFRVVAADPVATTSQVSVSPNVIENSTGAESIVTIIVRDQYGNRVLTDQSASLSLSLNRLEPAGAPSATLSGLSFSSQTNQHQAILSATNTQELVEVVATLNGVELPQRPTVDIVNPIIWSPGGGPENTRNNWLNPDNWTPNRVPGSGDFVIIPGGVSPYPDLDLNINLGSMDIQSGANLVLFGGNSIQVSGNLNVDGTLDIEDNTAIRVDGNVTGAGSFSSGNSTEIEIGGNLSLNSFLAGTDGTVVQFNGQSQQTITSPNILAERLEILNNVTVTAGDLISTSELFIEENNSFILQQDADITLDNLQSITGGGSLQLNNNTLVVRGDLELSSIDASQATVIFGIRIDEDFTDYPDLERQRISNLTEMKNAIVNNIEGVRTFDDIIIDGDLVLQNGNLIISSGRNFIAPNTTYVNGNLQFRRTLSNRGWKMLSTPVASTFQDLFDGLTVQGIPGSTYEDRQPNLMWYDETFADPNDPDLTTDNQRWTAPLNITDSPVTGRGYFFYVFGNVASDSDYNDELPTTLTISGRENFHDQPGSFNFPVTYSEDGDTGWNMIGNPFGATLDWDQPGWTKTNTDNALYIWDQNAQEYKYWNGEAGSHGSGRIAPFQGFWVKANADSPVLSVNPSNKTVGGQFRKENERYNRVPVIALQMESDFHTTSTHFSFTESGSFATDRMDAYRLLPFDAVTYLEIYSLFSDGTELAVNNLPRDFGKTIEIPIAAGAVVNNNYYNGPVTLTWPEMVNIPEGWKVELTDNHTGDTIDLKQNQFYDFEIRSQGKTAPVTNSAGNFRLQEKSAAKAKNARFTLSITPGEDGSEFPDEVFLDQNYPNPFNPSTTIEFALPVEDRVRIDVFDVIGRKVQTVVDQRYQAGYHEINFDGSSLASGVYFYRLITSDKVLSKRMTLIK
ncbi:invasin domain 3-containing protein [Rhodohalobacter halophilus]|uniref:invasin domain 3-containing protein n=1 Tax=Rhodohalobacter halophilus TaxID=1812810 RepID=UPI0009FD8C16|nr:invasin domain 3-containing protein [Rhodohalobacter halophilus]